MPSGARTPLVSVIIPVYRRPEELKQALDSVLSQSYSPFEVIVVDDCSGDEWAQRYEIPSGVTFISHPVNRGQSAARNTGFAASTGEIIAWLDSDDVWLPGYLESQVRLLLDNPACGIVYCHAVMVDENLIPLASQLEPLAIRDNPFPLIVKKNLIRSPSCTVARRSAVERAGCFDESIRGAEDWDLWINIARFSNFAYDPEPRILYRNHPSQSSRPGIHRLAVDEAVRTKWIAWAEQNDRGNLPVMRKALSRDLQRHASLSLTCGAGMRTALWRMQWAIRTYPRDVRNYTRLLRVLVQPLFKRRSKAL